MTCSDFVKALKMLICSEKYPVSRANHGYTKKVVTTRWPTIDNLLAEQFSANFDIKYDIEHVRPIIKFRA